MEIYEGRPADNSGRSEKENRVYDFLDTLEVAYQRVDHDPAMTMELCARIDQVLDTAICKNLMLCNRQKTQYYMLMLEGDKVFKTKDLSHQIGSSRLSFASAEHMEAFLDCAPGSASVLGLMNDKENRVKLLIDKDVLAGETIGFHPCINTSTLKLSTADLTEKVIPALGHAPTLVTL